jgi:hypothetical protein
MAVRWTAMAFDRPGPAKDDLHSSPVAHASSISRPKMTNYRALTVAFSLVRFTGEKFHHSLELTTEAPLVAPNTDFRSPVLTAVSP